MARPGAVLRRDAAAEIGHADLLPLGEPTVGHGGEEVERVARLVDEAIALVARCDLFITNDSGLMHVAGALGVPTVAIFGSTNPQTTYPLGERTVILRRPVDCSPCLKKECPTDFKCMDLVTVDEVYDESVRLLAEAGYP